MEYFCDRLDHVFAGVAFSLWSRKATECSVLSELFWRSLEDKNVETDTDDEGLSCGGSQGSKTLLAICVVVYTKNMWFWSSSLKNWL